MPVLPIRDMGTQGVSPDAPNYSLAPNGISDCLNMRVQDGQMKRSKGWVTLVDLTTDFVADFGDYVYPYYAVAYFSVGESGLIIIAGDQLNPSTSVKFFKFNGSSVLDISPVEAVTGDNWQVEQVNDGYLFNNKVSTPLIWNVGDDNLTYISNWPSGYVVEVIKKYKDFYVGLNTTESGINFKSKIIWSDIVDPETGETNWDFGDPTSLSGFNYIRDDEAGIKDANELNDQLFLYQAKNVSSMQFTGDQFVFRFRSVYEDGGTATTGTVAVLENTQMSLSSDDLYVSDGNNKKSIAVNRVREFLLANAKSVADVEFFPNRITNEIIIALRGEDQDFYNRALVYAYDYDAFTIIDLPDVNYITEGVEIIVSDINYDTIEGTYLSTSQRWSDTAGDVNKRVSYSASPINSKIYIMDDTYLHDGETYLSFIKRDGIDLDEVLNESSTLKSVVKCFPQFAGEGDLQIKFGGTSVPNGPITLEQAQTFRLGLDYEVDARTTQRYLSYQINMIGGGDWEITGMDLKLVSSGRR